MRSPDRIMKINHIFKYMHWVFEKSKWNPQKEKKKVKTQIWKCELAEASVQ